MPVSYLLINSKFIFTERGENMFNAEQGKIWNEVG